MITIPLLYIDPGSGSLLLYAVIGITATLFFTARGFWYDIKSRILRKKGTFEIPKDLPKLVFHSEGKKYWQVFQPVLKALEARNVQCAYVTPDMEDWKLAQEYANVVSIHPGSEMATIAYMNRIRAAFVVTTTPHLDIYMMKRSPYVKKYIYLFHAPTSVDVYEKFAFNHYDIMLCPGEFIEKYIRELEVKRGLPSKELHFVGCTYYDYMLKEIAELDHKKKVDDKSVILYAPTWGERSSLVKYGSKVLDILIDSPYQVIFRPHPQYYVSHSELISEIEARIQGGADVIIDRNITGIDSMAAADLLITDLSGIIFDYAYLFGKPIILLDVNLDLDGFEGGDLSESWNIEYSERLSSVVSEDELDTLCYMIEEQLKNSEVRIKEISALREGILAEFGTAGVASAETLIELTRSDL